MLTEIICDKFIQEKIVFNDGLNVILGDESSSNSIGKSTLLLIIDFIFGGDDYLEKSTGVIHAVGHHEFKYSFRFNDNLYYFTRGTADKNVVWICDKQYNRQSELKIKDYRVWLCDSYKLNAKIISFREMVSPFIRIWNRPSIKLTNKPLNASENEGYEDILNKLFKLYDKYEEYSKLKAESDKLERITKKIKAAENVEIIPTLSKKAYTKAKEEVSKLSEEISNIESELVENTHTFDSIVSKEILVLKSKKDDYIRKRNTVIHNLELINANLKINNTRQHLELERLIEYFPNINLQRLSEIDSFHKEISTILKSELNNRKKQLNDMQIDLNSKISEIENKISSTLSLSDKTIPKYMIEKIQDLTLEKNKYESVIELYDKKTDTKEKLDALTPEFNRLREENIENITQIINSTIQVICSNIYSKSKIPPVLAFEKKKYNYTYDIDTGTGSAYASVIIFDLAIMKTTKLPLLIHDSVLLKQIEDSVYEHIIEYYNTQDRQIFISTDNISKYTPQTQKIINNHSIISLSKERRLFGKAWDEMSES